MTFRFAFKTSFGHLQDVLARCLGCLGKTSLRHLVDVFLPTGSHGTTLTFLTSKYHLVPLKSFTVPRLELLACVLLSKLLVSVLETLKGEVKVTAMFCWSDSMVALWWIKEVHKRWGVWVQNKVEVIRGNTSPDIWLHVSSTSNSSDISTRSISLSI